MLRFALLLGLIFNFSTLQAQNLRGMMKVTATGASLFGEQIEAADVNGDGRKDLFVGAPGTFWRENAGAGAIVLFPGTVFDLNSGGAFRDSVLTLLPNTLVAGPHSGAYAGREFKIGRFNGDAIDDLAVTFFGTESQAPYIGIFYGPFIPGDVRQLPDVRINHPEPDEGFGIALEVLRGFSGSGRDALLVGMNLAGGKDQGEVRLFSALHQPGVLSSQTDAVTIFDGPEEGGLFGSHIAVLGDVNGDGRTDIAITAPSTSQLSNGFKRGSILLYFGPFGTGTVPATSAGVVFNGRQDLRSWGSRVFSAQDINRDGLSDFVFSSTVEEAVALAYGRRTWAPRIAIGAPNNAQDSLVMFRVAPGRTVMGISMEFSGDFNKDGTIDPLIGFAGSESTTTGAVMLYDLQGASRSVAAIGNAVGFGTALINAGNLSPNDAYNVDDIAIGNPRESNLQGVMYIMRGEINPPVMQLNVSPSPFLELGSTATLNFNWTKGSREIREIRLVRTLNNKNDTTRYPVQQAGSQQITVQSGVDASYTFNAEAVDDLGIRSGFQRSVFFAARPTPFDLVSSFSTPLQISGLRTSTQAFSWSASRDTNNRRSISYMVSFAMNPNALVPGSGVQGSMGAGVFSSTTGQIPFGTIRDLLSQSGIQTGQTVTMHWQVYATNGVLATPAANGPRPIQVTVGSLENLLQLTTANRAMRLFGLKEDFITFTWNALQSDQSDQIVRYEFQILESSQPGARVLFSDFSANNGFAREYRFTFDAAYQMLIRNNLLTQARDDSARVFFQARALINESVYWPANNGPRRLGIKFVRIFNDARDEVPLLPSALTLKANYPNPFNPVTTVPFGLPQPGRMTVDVYAVTGQRVYHWQSPGVLPAGWHEHRIDLSGAASGIYLVRVSAAGRSVTRKFTLLK